MKKIVLRKRLAVGIILVFIGVSVVPAINGINDYNNLVSESIIWMRDDCGCYSYGEIDGKYEKNLFIDYSVMSNPFPVDFLDTDGASSELTIIDTPDEFNWKDYDGKDWTTPARHQGNCGSCWLFSAFGALESAIEISESCADLNPDLSEQYVLSCLSAGDCTGGNMVDIWDCIINDNSSKGNYHNGVILESCFPYQVNDEIPCSDKCQNWENMLIPISGWDYCSFGFDYNNPESIAAIKSQIMLKGPVTAGINVNQLFMSWGGINHKPTGYFPYYGEKFRGYVNHVVVIVGWKDDPSIKNGGYWICKNSWGADWGYDGFFNIEYGGLFTGRIIAWVDYDSESYDWAPIANAGGFYQGEIGQEIIFDASNSFDAEGDIISHYWDFGDGTNDTGVTPMHIYSQSGIFKVTLTVKDRGNKTSSDLTLIGIEKQPIDIKISGGKGFTIVIRNPSEFDLFDKKLSVDLTPSIINGNSRGKMIQLIPAKGEYTITLSSIGIGIGIITVAIESILRTSQFFIIGPFVIMPYNDCLRRGSV